MNGRDRRRLIPAVMGGGLSKPIAQWKLDETSGDTVYDTAGKGSLNGTVINATLNDDTFIDGGGAVLFSAAASSRITFAANPIPAFNGNSGTYDVYCKISAEEWADGAGSSRYLFGFGANSSNYIAVVKAGIYLLQTYYVAGGTVEGVSRYLANTDYLRITLTWDKPNDVVKVYFDGLIYGTTSTLGVWSGTLVTLYSAIGSQLSSGYGGSNGHLARLRIWNRALSASEILSSQLVEFPSAKGLLCVGDSKTFNAPWPNLLADALTTAASSKHVSRKDIAMGAYDVTELKDWLPSQLAATSESVDVICLNIGANDVPQPTPQAQFEADLSNVINQLLAKYATANIYVAKIWRRSYAVNVGLINGYIDTVVASYGGTRVFAGHNEAVWMEGGDDGVTYTTDGVHPKIDATVQPFLVTQWMTAMGY